MDRAAYLRLRCSEAIDPSHEMARRANRGIPHVRAFTSVIAEMKCPAVAILVESEACLVRVARTDGECEPCAGGNARYHALTVH